MNANTALHDLNAGGCLRSTPSSSVSHLRPPSRTRTHRPVSPNHVLHDINSRSSSAGTAASHPGSSVQISLPEAAKLWSTEIRSWASRSQQAHYVCGSNFQHLAEFLQSKTCVEESHTEATSDYPYVLQWTLASETEKASLRIFVSSQAFSTAQQQASNNNTTTIPHITFMRGYPSPDWLKLIGSHYKADGEFFRQHLDFMQSKTFYELPALSSASKNIFRLQIPCLFQRRLAISWKNVMRNRVEASEIVRANQQRLGRRVGDSIVRRYHAHDETMFVLEQLISCYVMVSKSAKWSAIIWLDSGRPLDLNAWTTDRAKTQGILNATAACIPTIQYHEKACLIDEVPQLVGEGDGTSSSTTRDPRFSNSADEVQSASLLPFQYGSSLEEKLMKKDVMYALSELFGFAAFSENQFINHLHVLVDEALRYVDNEQERTLTTLRHTSSILDEHISCISGTLKYIRRGGEPDWPICTDSNDRAIVLERRRTLLLEFETILRRARELANRCSRNSHYIMNGAAVQEARDSKLQARKIEGLTKLAFLFVPVAFVCSFFGMNFHEFGQGPLSIWVFFVTGIPILIISALFVFRHQISRFRFSILRNHIF